jgi:hypothetical protein
MAGGLRFAASRSIGGRRKCRFLISITQENSMAGEIETQRGSSGTGTMGTDRERDRSGVGTDHDRSKDRNDRNDGNDLNRNDRNDPNRSSQGANTNVGGSRSGTGSGSGADRDRTTQGGQHAPGSSSRSDQNR